MLTHIKKRPYPHQSKVHHTRLHFEQHAMQSNAVFAACCASGAEADRRQSQPPHASAAPQCCDQEGAMESIYKSKTHGSESSPAIINVEHQGMRLQKMQKRSFRNKVTIRDQAATVVSFKAEFHTHGVQPIKPGMDGIANFIGRNLRERY